MNLEDQFGYLAAGYRVTSPRTDDYNCIAWAAGRTDRWWWPVNPPGTHYYWPPNAPKVVSLAAFISAFQSVGFQICADGSLESGVEKIAIYAVGPTPKHAARQLPSGRWTSKLGSHVDVEHALHSLDGAQYGVPVQYMQRPRRAPQGKDKKKRRRR